MLHHNTATVVQWLTPLTQNWQLGSSHPTRGENFGDDNCAIEVTRNECSTGLLRDQDKFKLCMPWMNKGFAKSMHYYMIY